MQLNAVTDVSVAAAGLGVAVGMTGAEAIEMMRETPPPTRPAVPAKL